MQTTNVNKNGRSNDPVWQFLAEYSLSEYMSDNVMGDNQKVGSLFQTMRDLGLPPECLANIEMTLAGFTKDTWMHYEQGSLELPGRIRLFCQKQMIVNANSAKTLIPCNAEQSMEPAPIINLSGAKMNRGWGYFLIERGVNYSASYSGNTCNSIDLYLYKEGE